MVHRRGPSDGAKNPVKSSSQRTLVCPPKLLRPADTYWRTHPALPEELVPAATVSPPAAIRLLQRIQQLPQPARHCHYSPLHYAVDTPPHSTAEDHLLESRGLLSDIPSTATPPWYLPRRPADFCACSATSFSDLRLPSGIGCLWSGSASTPAPRTAGSRGPGLLPATEASTAQPLPEEGTHRLNINGPLPHHHRTTFRPLP